ncbi:MAG TPA: hypothetical protein VGW34_09470 [Allosphingosinicella sp.]|nr:hypothetical protein [Allosphingosinicella sp.]
MPPAAALEEAPAKAVHFKGRKNIYVCDTCHGHIVTVDVDEGVTPYLIECRAAPLGCPGYMQSSMYRVFNQRMRASWEWYKPAAIEMLDEFERDHVASGGLLLRKAPPLTSLQVPLGATQ